MRRSDVSRAHVSSSFANLAELAEGGPGNPLTKPGSSSALSADSSGARSEDRPDRLIMVSNQLPVRMKRREAAAPAGGHSWEFEWDEDSLVGQAKAGIEQPQFQAIQARGRCLCRDAGGSVPSARTSRRTLRCSVRHSREAGRLRFYVSRRELALACAGGLSLRRVTCDAAALALCPRGFLTRRSWPRAGALRGRVAAGGCGRRAGRGVVRPVRSLQLLARHAPHLVSHLS